MNPITARRIFAASLMATTISGFMLSMLFWPLLPVTLATYIHYRRLLPKPNYGLLSHRKRPRLPQKQRVAMTAYLITVRTSYAVNVSEGNIHSSHYISTHEVIRILKRYGVINHPGGFSDDALCSFYQLHMYSIDLMKADTAPSARWLEGVDDPAPFHELRTSIREFKARRQEADHAAWKRHVGNTDANHLLKNGMVAFLETLPGNDLTLWHMIVTESHELLNGDNLRAAFWIMRQPECDLYSAHQFIHGMVFHEILDRALGHADPEYKSFVNEQFRLVLMRWNKGFYCNRLVPVRDNYWDDVVGLECNVLMSELDAIARKHSLAPFEEPVGISESVTPATLSAVTAYRSPYNYWYDEGLHLRYPGPSWREMLES